MLFSLPLVHSTDSAVLNDNEPAQFRLEQGGEKFSVLRIKLHGKEAVVKLQHADSEETKPEVPELRLQVLWKNLKAAAQSDPYTFACDAGLVAIELFAFANTLAATVLGVLLLCCLWFDALRMMTPSF